MTARSDDLVAIRDDLPRLVQRLVDWQVANIDRQQGVGVQLVSVPDVFVQWVATGQGRGARMEVSAAAVDRREPLVDDWLATEGFVQQRLPSGRRVWAADDFDALRSSAVTICEGVFEDLAPYEPLCWRIRTSGSLPRDRDHALGVPTYVTAVAAQVKPASVNIAPIMLNTAVRMPVCSSVRSAPIS